MGIDKKKVGEQKSRNRKLLWALRNCSEFRDL